MGHKFAVYKSNLRVGTTPQDLEEESDGDLGEWGGDWEGWDGD